MGREDELAAAGNLLEHNRLLTLTGAGGSGKTRLCIELASRTLDGFAEGVHFVSLADIRDPSLVPVSIAQCIGLHDARGGTLLEHLSSYLRDRKLMLVLDNFEQVLHAADFVQHLLDESIHLRILVTSRSPLHVSSEQEYPVPPLRVPERGPAWSAASVAAYSSAQLFAARAAARLPGFTINDQNAEAIARIVERLDGLPLAIELAAARVKLLPLETILARLEDSLALLVGGAMDVPDRQRTLRATIAWSYDLLSEAAARLLAASSVFRGGISLPSITAVCASALDPGAPILDALQELVDHSLLRLTAGSAPVPRYSMLETVREFAAEQLSTLPEAAAVHEAACRAVPSSCQGSRAPSVLACQGGPRPARARARQLPGRPRLVPAGESGSGVAARQPAHRVLVCAGALLGGQAAAGRAARSRPGRQPRSGRGHERRRLARHRPGRLCRSRRPARAEHRPRPRRKRHGR